MPYKIAMYTRLSRDDKTKIESESIINQKSIIENFVKNNDELKESEVISYSDDGYVGSNFNRPAIKQLIEDAKKGKINCIIVKDLSRFGRNYVEVGTYLDKIFPFLNIRFIAINDNYDSKNNKNSTTDLDIAFKNILYDYYNKDLSKKVKTGIVAKAKQGDYIASSTPFGYKKNKETKRLEIDEETAPIVKMIFELLLKKNTYSEVCKILNEMKIPTKSDFKIKNGIRKEYSRKVDNKIWKSNDIKVMKNNEFYIGNTVYFKRKRVKCGSDKSIKNNETFKIENTHKPIISKDIFYILNSKIISKNKISTSKNIENIFINKLKCKNCGYALEYNYVYKNKQKIDRKYYCESFKEQGNISCGKINILESELKEIVLESFKKQVLIYLKEKDKIVSRGNLSKDISDLENKQKDLIFARRLLYEDYINRKISKEDYLKIKTEKELLINNLKKDIEKLNDKFLENKNIEEEIKILKKYLKEDSPQKIIDIFLEKIYIYDKNIVNINWNFKKY